MLEGDELEEVYEYTVSLDIRNVLGERLEEAFPDVRGVPVICVRVFGSVRGREVITWV